MSAIYLGLVNWLVTLVLVESELTRPVRDFFEDRRNAADEFAVVTMGNDDFTEAEQRTAQRRYTAWSKARYFVSCHLCAGTWVGLLLASLVPGARPLGGGALGLVLAGFLFKAIGHITLEITALMQRSAK